MKTLAEHILAEKANTVDNFTAEMFFDQFCEHFNLTEYQIKMCEKDFWVMMKMPIPFSIALNTAMAFAQMFK